jgi:cytochrome c biogenesis protein CcmG, thiol:disulfide interchange protein DsbE
MPVRRLLLLVPAACLGALLLFGYLSALPVAVERSRRSACTLVRLEPYEGRLAARDLPLQTLDDQPLDLGARRGRLVLLNFWMTSCPPCLQELPGLLELAARLEHRKLEVVLVATDKSGEDVRQLLAQQPALRAGPPNVVYARDPGGRVARRLGTTRYPETYLVAPTGRITDRVVGPRDWTRGSVSDCLIPRLP